MKSIKPGRGPSAMEAVGSLAAVIFGIIWTVMAASMGAPALFPFFGVLFVLLGVVGLVYSLKNATGENRFSIYDITDDGEEPDPLDRRFHSTVQTTQEDADSGAFRFCPYCGAKLGSAFTYCGKCGKKLPNDR
jgi:hypothetical protein